MHQPRHISLIYRRCFKRVLDLLLAASVQLLLLSPLLAAFSLLVWHFQGCPVLFAQRRRGWQGRPFLI